MVLHTCSPITSVVSLPHIPMGTLVAGTLHQPTNNQAFVVATAVEGIWEPAFHIAYHCPLARIFTSSCYLVEQCAIWAHEQPLQPPILKRDARVVFRAVIQVCKDTRPSASWETGLVATLHKGLVKHHAIRANVDLGEYSDARAAEELWVIQIADKRVRALAGACSRMTWVAHCTPKGCLDTTRPPTDALAGKGLTFHTHDHGSAVGAHKVIRLTFTQVRVLGICISHTPLTSGATLK